MWYPAAVTVAASSEPVTLAAVKMQVRPDTDVDDDLLERLITQARAHVEMVATLWLMPQTLALKCDGFSDFARLPVAPVQSITSITYVDVDGATQTLSAGVYELRADGLDAAIVLKYGQNWPSIRPGSRITLTLSVGFATVPPPIIGAIMLLIGAWYENREQTIIGVSIGELPPTVGVDALLINYRIGV